MSGPVNGRRWISPKECGELLSFHVEHVYVLLARGEIPAARIGHSWRVDRQRLEAQLERQIGGAKK